MNPKEAQQFVARFVTGEYAPEEYAAFLMWLKEATVAELDVIADMHEANQGKWVLPEGPSAEWVMQMERKLDESATVMDDRELEEADGNGLVVVPVGGMRPGKVIRWGGWKAWMSEAAVVSIVSAGTYIYIQQTKPGVHESRDREKLLAMTLSNPRGGEQKELTLEDGSKVWLNAGSKLKYPAHFTGSERLVELSGEAFFEVAGSSDNPFRVRIRDAEVEVLGTFFDLKAYDNEPGSTTTVVKGSVKVTSGPVSQVLKPGDQADVAYASPGVGATINVHSGIDPKTVLDWKVGIYRFRSTELRTITRELERVYNVTVQFQPTVGNPRIDGILDINKGLDIVLKQLEGSLLNKVQLKIDGNTVRASSV